MTVPPDPVTVFHRAAEEGERRLEQSLLELVATSFIAGFTVVFGIVALALVDAAVGSGHGGVGHIAGSLAFGLGMVFLIVGRSELFTENFSDPTAALIRDASLERAKLLLRLWAVTFCLNLVGGVLFVGVFSVDGTIPPGAVESLRHFAVEFTHRSPAAEFSKGIAGGALVAILSFLLAAVDSIGSRIIVTYAVGFLLALGTFDHVIVTLLHLAFGLFLGASVPLTSVAVTAATVTAGNVVGGLGLVTLSHTAQVWGANESSD